MTVEIAEKPEGQLSSRTEIWQSDELTARNAAIFCRWVCDKLDGSISHLEIDIGEVEYVNAGGLASMIWVNRITSLKAIRITWRNANRNVATLIQLAGIGDILKLT